MPSHPPSLSLRLLLPPLPSQLVKQRASIPVSSPARAHYLSPTFSLFPLHLRLCQSAACPFPPSASFTSAGLLRPTLPRRLERCHTPIPSGACPFRRLHPLPLPILKTPPSLPPLSAPSPLSSSLRLPIRTSARLPSPSLSTHRHFNFANLLPSSLLSSSPSQSSSEKLPLPLPLGIENTPACPLQSPARSFRT